MPVFLIFFRKGTDLIREHVKGVLFNALPIASEKFVASTDA